MSEAASTSIVPSRAAKLSALISDMLALSGSGEGSPQPASAPQPLDLHETLLIQPEWRWLGLVDVEDQLEIALAPGQVGEAPVSRDAQASALPETEPELLYWYSISGEMPERRGLSPHLRFFPDLDTAILCGAHLVENQERLEVKQATPAALIEGGIPLSLGLFSPAMSTLISDALLSRLEEIGDPIERDDILMRGDALKYQLLLGESLFLTDYSQRTEALRGLHRDYDKKTIELDLSSHLADEDPEVRMNAYQALSYCAYSTPAKVSEDRQQWRARLRENSIELVTLDTILPRLSAERDDAVLDYAFCMLKAQSYEGSLRQGIPRLRTLVKTLRPEIESPRTLEDILELARKLNEAIPPTPEDLEPT